MTDHVHAAQLHWVLIGEFDSGAIKCGQLCLQEKDTVNINRVH